jgi:RNA polymerase sigma factor (sigma-70 family)
VSNRARSFDAQVKGGRSVSDDVTRSAVEAVFRIEAPRLIGALTRRTRDVGRAEDLAQDALVAALEQWPRDGIPGNPAAWLMAAAKNRAVDRFRRDAVESRVHESIGREQGPGTAPGAMDEALDDDLGDDLLRLMFVACHPELPPDGRVALTLRILGGLTTAEIARAFLVPEATIAQRIVRAKRTLAEKRVPFEVPRGEERAGRLASVLETIYFLFNEGYAASSGDEWMRPELSEEALRLGRVLAGLAPYEPEVHGLVALMELQASRFPARRAPDGAPVLLLDQNRALWDPLLIRRGLAALDRALRLADPPGPCTLQAAITACHARARSAAETDWAAIVSWYDALLRRMPSPVVELNRAVAVGMSSGPAVALPLVEALASHPALASYHLLPSVRGDLLEKLGRREEAGAEYARAASLTGNDRERALLAEKAARCGQTRP